MILLLLLMGLALGFLEIGFLEVLPEGWNQFNESCLEFGYLDPLF